MVNGSCTILCASYWSAWSAREASIKHEKLLKDAPEELLKMETSGSGVVDINTASALLFVVIASYFLILLYKRMSSWFVELLVILFCIGGVKGLQTWLVVLLSRWFKRAGESFIEVPFFGDVSYLTLTVSPFCLAFAVIWAVYRRISFALIGQDILGIALIITVLQIVHVPNLKMFIDQERDIATIIRGVSYKQQEIHTHCEGNTRGWSSALACINTAGGKGSEKGGDYMDWGQFQVDAKSFRDGRHDISTVYAGVLNSNL
ncbi:Peptidase A22B signal peptide peptidase protein [Dioscorea alata]|uniref:Peptidase A22B signal peptide peptidase protein n=1 Tax=Dioscorea alata TaxID=55571 RepID=A0ACB7WSN4_DIOAL|nr:Peptidase A22B signal peptide peptidase protein [Dioscorea alata]